MDLISASQIVRAKARIQASRPYVAGIERVLAITASDVASSPIRGVPADPRRVAVVAIVADRGLCGAYNSNVLRATNRLLRAGEAEGRVFTLITVGRRAQRFFRFHGRQIARSFVKMTDRPTYEDARRVAGEIVGPFLAGQVDLVQLVSTRFHSAGRQLVEVSQLLPLAPGEPATHGDGPGTATSRPEGFYDFEPAAADLLAVLVPRFAEAVLFRALLEAAASEHTARQRAMSAAADNADELATTLNRLMNRIRQDAITTEIMDVVGGAEALRRTVGAGGSEVLTGSSSEE
jgi:F-type H+-transporting ATPase subunit gamma